MFLGLLSSYVNQPGRLDPSGLIGVFFFNNSNEIKVNQICLLKCAEIYIENYVDATLYVLGKHSWTIISSHWNTIVLLYSEIRCLHPNDPNLKTRLSSKWFGDYTQYQCNEGFTPTANWARCTENGWTPNPLCEGIFIRDFYWCEYLVMCGFLHFLHCCTGLSTFS